MTHHKKSAICHPTKKHCSKGLCQQCYDHQRHLAKMATSPKRKKGPPRGYIFKPLAKRFWSKVDKTSQQPCWIWTALRTRSYPSHPYGRLRISRKWAAAHRISWEIHYGKIPEGMLVCHSCDNTLCVNPNHLFLGTSKDNTQDMMNKGRGAGQKGTRFQPDVAGLNNGRARLTPKDVLAIRQDQNKSLKEWSEVLGVAERTVDHVLKGSTWQHLL